MAAWPAIEIVFPGARQPAGASARCRSRTASWPISTAWTSWPSPSSRATRGRRC
ncbi:MAG: hypothetical protein MZW92_07345 [Comamonadaceae bacterium]|nr:hypothetical protein [Comamonadaceae bacterium]